MDAFAVVGFIGFLIGCLFGVWSGIRIMKHLTGGQAADRRVASIDQHKERA